jgi:NADH:ubiquinone oxidoreductase subunit 6 (subunit J)
MIETIMFYLLGSLILITGSLVISTRNTLYSILYLALVFCNSAGLLFLLEVEFLALLLLIVYVGAILVLFLFVVMMLNIRVTETKEGILHSFPIAGPFLFMIFGLTLSAVTQDIRSFLFPELLELNSYPVFHVPQFEGFFSKALTLINIRHFLDPSHNPFSFIGGGATWLYNVLPESHGLGKGVYRRKMTHPYMVRYVHAWTIQAQEFVMTSYYKFVKYHPSRDVVLTEKEKSLYDLSKKFKVIMTTDDAMDYLDGEKTGVPFGRKQMTRFPRFWWVGVSSGFFSLDDPSHWFEGFQFDSLLSYEEFQSNDDPPRLFIESSEMYPSTEWDPEYGIRLRKEANAIDFEYYLYLYEPPYRFPPYDRYPKINEDPEYAEFLRLEAEAESSNYKNSNSIVVRLYNKELNLNLWSNDLECITNIEAIGELLYTHYFFCFLLASLILLVSMIGAILLTMRKQINVRRQNVFDQVFNNLNTNALLVK